MKVEFLKIKTRGKYTPERLVWSKTALLQISCYAATREIRIKKNSVSKIISNKLSFQLP